jgi:hypothetical protein
MKIGVVKAQKTCTSASNKAVSTKEELALFSEVLLTRIG